ncbi:MAG: hypothetical protein HRT45_05985 [Bdellovibrionales bacterium]|nr:hypothetical protein [Bdellovibrionales bacterium]
MQWGLSFKQILEQKIDGTPSEIETKNAHFSLDLAFEMPIFSSESQNFRFQPQQKTVADHYESLLKAKVGTSKFDQAQQKKATGEAIDQAEPTQTFDGKTSQREQAQPSERHPVVDVRELSSLGAIAYRTLWKVSGSPLANELSTQYLKTLKRTLSKQHHPDHGGTAEVFMAMLEALTLLTEEVERALEERAADEFQSSTEPPSKR